MKLPTRMRRRPESHRVLPINGRGLDFRATPAWSRPDSNGDQAIFDRPLSRLSYGSGGRGRIRTCDRVCAPGIKSPVPWSAWLRVRSEPGRIRTDAGLVKGQRPDRARRPAQWAPADLNGHIVLPRHGCCQVTPRARGRFAGFAAPLGQRSQRHTGGRRYHWWPRDAARMPSRSQRRRRRIPTVRLVRNRITSVSLGPDRGRAGRTLTASSTDSHAALTPCPVSRDRRTRRASALNMGSPRRAVSG